MLVSMVGGPPSDLVNYSSAWALDSSSPLDLTSTFTSTLSRGSAGINLSFSFTFEELAIEVHGSSFWNSSQPPTWECSLDQIPANTPNIPSGPGAWERQCGTPAALNMPHVLTVNVTDSGPTGLQFDYTPSDKLGLQSGLISGIYRIDQNDPAILYNLGWSIFNIFGNGTSTPTRITQLSLNGQAVSFPESSPAESPSAMTASYSVDGKPPIIFALNNRGGNTTTTTFDLEFFGVTSLVPGNHSLQVAHLGGPAIGTSLSLYYFRGLGLISGSISETNGTTPPFALPQQPSGQTTDMRQTIGLIISIVVGMLAFLTLATIAVIFSFLCRRQHLSQFRPRGDTEARVSFRALQLPTFIPRKKNPTNAHPYVTPFLLSTDFILLSPVSSNSPEPLETPTSRPVHSAQILPAGGRDPPTAPQTNRYIPKAAIARLPPAVSRGVPTDVPPQYSA